jgi:hypothetical protein
MTIKSVYMQSRSLLTISLESAADPGTASPSSSVVLLSRDVPERAGVTNPLNASFC